MMFCVSEVTIAVKAAPMITATARSITLPRRIKSRKPLSTLTSVSFIFLESTSNAMAQPLSLSRTSRFAREYIARTVSVSDAACVLTYALSMRVRLLSFGPLKSALPPDGAWVELDDERSVAELVRALVDEGTFSEAAMRTAAVAVNH